MNKDDFPLDAPDITVNAREAFGLEKDWMIPAFSKTGDYTPEMDPAYRFDPETTRALLAGFTYNRRVMVQGYHGTGKSTHIEQIAARLGWPVLRVNLDSHISRSDLIGKDTIVLKQGLQVTEFQEGALPFALTRPVALVFDEYDAGRPDVMFVIQRVLEEEGRLTLPDQSRVLTPHPFFRLFATTNTVGLGDAAGLYQGTQILNQGQLDRWSLIAHLHYLDPEEEVKIILAKNPGYDSDEGQKTIKNMVQTACLIRNAFMQGDISTVMSPRTVLAWASNFEIFEDIATSFRLTFLNRCDDHEKPMIAELYQRVFGEDLPLSSHHISLVS